MSKCKDCWKTICPEVTLNTNGTNRKYASFQICGAVFAEHIKLNCIKFFLCCQKFFIIFFRPGFSVIAQYVD